MVEDISMSLGDLKGRPLGEIEPHPIDFMIASDLYIYAGFRLETSRNLAGKTPSQRTGQDTCQWAKVQGIDSRDEELQGVRFCLLDWEGVFT